MGCSTFEDVWLLPKPCSTRKAARRSPGLMPSGRRTVPASLRPAEGMVTACSVIGRCSVVGRDRDDFIGTARGLGQERQRAAGILDLLEADQVAALALAVAAAAHVEAERDIAEVVEHLGGLQHVRGFVVAAEAVQHQEGGAPLAGLDAVRDPHGAGELEARGWDGDGLLGHRQVLRAT